MNTQQRHIQPIDDGGPALPHEDSGSFAFRPGLTKREYFAGLAMRSLLLRPDFEATHISVLVVNCCEMADAMLVALKSGAESESLDA